MGDWLGALLVFANCNLTGLAREASTVYLSK